MFVAGQGCPEFGGSGWVLGVSGDQGGVLGVCGRVRAGSWVWGEGPPGCARPAADSPGRHGLSEPELKDVLSLDDEVLQAVYRDWTPPSRELLRFPPLLWVRLRRDLGHCLARRPVDGFTLLGIAQR